MNRSEISLLLGAIAARDQRTIGDTDVLAWHEDLSDLDFPDARQAVTRHFRESTDRIMPAHIRRLVRVIRDERRAHEVVRELPPGKFEDDPERIERIRRHAAGLHAMLEELAAKRAVPDGQLSRSDEIHLAATTRTRQESGQRPPLPKIPKTAGKGRGDFPDPVEEQARDLAKRYLREGYEPDDVAERLGVSRKWCRKNAKRLAAMGPIGWCGQCTYDGRMRKPGPTQAAEPCPDCHPDHTGEPS